jgi:adenylate cyclase
MGDGVLLEFPSVVAAVECAVAIQKLMAARHADAPQDKRIVYRIGVSLGDVLIDGEDILGDGVNIATRLEGICEPGGVTISGSAFDHVRDKVDAKFVDIGEKALKNIARPVRAFQLEMTQVTGADSPAGSIKSTKISAFATSTRLKALLIGLALLLIIVGSATWLRPSLMVEAPTAVEPMATASKRSIAVLPFTNMSREQNQDYFADGLSDDLTTKLSQIPDLFVIAQSSMYAYKGKSVSTQEVAQRLGVRYVLEGSVRRSENRLRINANLIEANSARQLWAEEYDVENSSLFTVQDKVIQEIVSALALQLTNLQQSHLARVPTSNLEAYDYYLRAENEDYYNDKVNESALQFYDKAIQLDPNFSDAQAGYARAAVEIWRLSYAYPFSSVVIRKRAYDAAGRAIKLDGNNGRAFTALAMLQLSDGRHDEAVISARRAVALNPSDAEAILNLAVILAYSGESSEAVAVAEQALRLSPLAPPGLRVLAGTAFYNAREYRRAIEEFKVVTAAWPATPNGAHEYLAASYAHLGDLDHARREFSEIPRYSLQATSLAMARLYLGPYYRHAEDLDSHLDALKAAGIPEWPYGFEGRAEDRVIGSALEALTSGRTWTGYVPAGPGEKTPFIQQFDLDNRVVFKGARSLLTGTVALSNDQICIRFDGYLWGRPLCGSVYRNQTVEGSDAGYIHVMPDSLRYFSPSG